MQNFVKVDTPKANRRVLTPHQAEKMKRRVNDIPSIANENSQASQLPSEFVCLDSQDK